MKNKVYEELLKPVKKRVNCFNILIGAPDEPRKESQTEKKREAALKEGAVRSVS